MEVTPPESDIMEITPTQESMYVEGMFMYCLTYVFTFPVSLIIWKIKLPKILRMKEDDALLAITMPDLFINTMFYEGEWDEEQIRAPFLFTFQRVEDMEFFLQEIRDKRDICVSYLHNPHLWIYKWGTIM